MVAWLHLADWHHRSTEFDQELILDQLIDDISKRTELHSALARLDFVVFTGDIAYSGQPEQYSDAIKRFFNPILDACELEPNRLFVVPGNHDVGRERLTSKARDQFRSLWSAKTPIELRNAINRVLQENHQRQHFLNSFCAYRTFLTDYLHKTFADAYVDPAYYTTTLIDVNGTSIAIVCLNSSWLSAYNVDKSGRINDYGYLAIGEAQLKAALTGSSTADVVIALLHHPTSWLTEFDRISVEEWLSRECHFILHGHQHTPRVHIHESTEGDVIVIPAGAAYQERFPADPRHVSAYNFVHFDPAHRTGMVHLRRWFEQKKQWDRDDQLWRQGMFPFILPDRYEATAAQKRTALYEVRREMSPFLRRRFFENATIEIIHEIEQFNDVELVRHQCFYDMILGRGEDTHMEFTTAIDEEAIELADQNELDIELYQLGEFLVDDDVIFPTVTERRRFTFEPALKDCQARIRYSYVLYEPLRARWKFILQRFAQRLEVRIKGAERLRYDFEPAGALAQLPITTRADGVKLFAPERACFPFEGISVRWGPIGSRHSNKRGRSRASRGAASQQRTG